MTANRGDFRPGPGGPGPQFLCRPTPSFPGY